MCDGLHSLDLGHSTHSVFELCPLSQVVLWVATDCEGEGRVCFEEGEGVKTCTAIVHLT